MKLTPSEKRDVYTYCMLVLTERINDESEDGWIGGFCGIVDCVKIRRRYIDLYDDLPELLKQKPKDHGIFWWTCWGKSGYNSRMEALAKAIELTYKKNW